MTTVAIIQARMGSTRLPGKIMQNLDGAPVLVRCVERTRRVATLDAVIVATTEEPADDGVVALCRERDYPCTRGSQDDVLDRYYRAAQQYHADIIVRITSDCPLIEPTVIDSVVHGFYATSCDYASNTLPPRNYPRGLDVEVFRFDALARAWREDQNPAWREHVTPYIYRHPELFTLHTVVNDVDYSHMRWTVDTPEDLAFVRKIYEAFDGRDDFTWHEVLHLLEQHPEWLDINRNVPQKEVQ
jgi:spore coat polysaccharide biosynthesis protein SpsF